MTGRASETVPRVETIENSGRPITVSIHGEGSDVVALAPGAGGTRTSPPLLAAAARLAANRSVVLFQFPYQEAKRRLPDPAPLLEVTVTSVATFCRASLGAKRLFLGGRSMGGRICSQAVAKGLACDGLVFLAYPLHPPGKPDQRRDTHLPRLTCPLLFAQGTRDVFARLDLLKKVVQGLGALATLELFDDADHAFKTPRGARRNSKETEAAMLDTVAAWLDRR